MTTPRATPVYTSSSTIIAITIIATITITITVVIMIQIQKRLKGAPIMPLKLQKAKSSSTLP